MRRSWLMRRSVRCRRCCVASPQSNSQTSARCGSRKATAETLRALVGTPELVPKKVICMRSSRQSAVGSFLFSLPTAYCLLVHSVRPTFCAAARTLPKQETGTRVRDHRRILSPFAEKMLGQAGCVRGRSRLFLSSPDSKAVLAGFVRFHLDGLAVAR